jgi:hypothetical protein
MKGHTWRTRIGMLKARIVDMYLAFRYRDAGPGRLRLVGTWHSNGPLTVRTLPIKWPREPRRQEALESIFGRMSIRYDEKFMQSSLPSRAAGGRPTYLRRRPYRLLASGSRSIAVLSSHQLTGALELGRVHFDGPDRYWIFIPELRAKEYFDRVAEDSPNQALEPIEAAQRQ